MNTGVMEKNCWCKRSYLRSATFKTVIKYFNLFMFFENITTFSTFLESKRF